MVEVQDRDLAKAFKLRKNVWIKYYSKINNFADKRRMTCEYEMKLIIHPL